MVNLGLMGHVVQLAATVPRPADGTWSSWFPVSSKLFQYLWYSASEPSCPDDKVSVDDGLGGSPNGFRLSVDSAEFAASSLIGSCSDPGGR